MLFTLIFYFPQKWFPFIEMFMILWRGMKLRLFFLGNLQPRFILSNSNYNQLSLGLGLLKHAAPFFNDICQVSSSAMHKLLQRLKQAQFESDVSERGKKKSIQGVSHSKRNI